MRGWSVKGGSGRDALPSVHYFRRLTGVERGMNEEYFKHQAGHCLANSPTPLLVQVKQLKSR